MNFLLRERDYPENLISSEMQTFNFSKLKIKSNDKNHNMKDLPLVLSYHTLLKSLGAIIDTNVSILHMVKDVKKLFTSRFFLCSACKLNSYLVRDNLYLLERMVGSYKCRSKRCQVFNNIM